MMEKLCRQGTVQEDVLNLFLYHFSLCIHRYLITLAMLLLAHYCVTSVLN